MEKPTMLHYIYDQPRKLQEIFANRKALSEPFGQLLKKHGIRRIYITGSGTSYHAALLMRMYFENFLRIETSVSIPTAFTRYETIDPGGQYRREEILVIAISQSGTSLSSIEAIRHARQEGCVSIALTQDETSLITKEAQYVLPLACGKERIPIETRGYTATLLTALLWALEGALAIHALQEAAYKTKMEEIERDLLLLPQVLRDAEAWYASNKHELITMTRASIAGYGYNYVTALEACLKLYETYHKPISAHELEEMIHGFEMAFDHDHHLFLIAADGPELANIEAFRDFFDPLTPHHFVITAEKLPLRAHDLFLSVRVCAELSPIAYIIPFQLLAARNCEAIGYDTSVYPHARRSFSHKRD